MFSSENLAETECHINTNTVAEIDLKAEFKPSMVSLLNVQDAMNSVTVFSTYFSFPDKIAHDIEMTIGSSKDCSVRLPNQIYMLQPMHLKLKLKNDILLVKPFNDLGMVTIDSSKGLQISSEYQVKSNEKIFLGSNIYLTYSQARLECSSCNMPKIPIYFKRKEDYSKVASTFLYTSSNNDDMLCTSNEMEYLRMLMCDCTLKQKLNCLQQLITDEVSSQYNDKYSNFLSKIEQEKLEIINKKDTKLQEIMLKVKGSSFFDIIDKFKKSNSLCDFTSLIQEIDLEKSVYDAAIQETFKSFFNELIDLNCRSTEKTFEIMNAKKDYANQEDYPDELNNSILEENNYLKEIRNPQAQNIPSKDFENPKKSPFLEKVKQRDFFANSEFKSQKPVNSFFFKNEKNHNSSDKIRNADHSQNTKASRQVYQDHSVLQTPNGCQYDDSILISKHNFNRQLVRQPHSNINDSILNQNATRINSAGNQYINLDDTIIGSGRAFDNFNLNDTIIGGILNNNFRQPYPSLHSKVTKSRFVTIKEEIEKESDYKNYSEDLVQVGYIHIFGLPTRLGSQSDIAQSLKQHFGLKLIEVCPSNSFTNEFSIKLDIKENPQFYADLASDFTFSYKSYEIQMHKCKDQKKSGLKVSCIRQKVDTGKNNK